MYVTKPLIETNEFRFLLTRLSSKTQTHTNEQMLNLKSQITCMCGNNFNFNEQGKKKKKKLIADVTKNYWTASVEQVVKVSSFSEVST